ncbi:MAG TPA: hypothetical protein VGR57_05645 [Ktedonobacterales bacterium]|nr:hypothetical protein [Ktedonobacterales bacterium]
MSQPPDPVNPFDPFGTLRTARDAYMDTWSKAMLDLVNSEGYAQATSRMLDSYLTVSNPVRKLLETSMAQVLAQLNMPTRADVVSLAERMTNIEMRLDDLDARFDQLERLLRERPATPSAPAVSAAPASAPARRRGRPPGAAKAASNNA